MYLPKLLITLVWSVMLSYLPMTLWAAETPLNPNVSSPVQTPTGEVKYSGPPIIKYYLSDDNNVIIKVDGLLLDQVEGYLWNGQNISEMLAQWQTQGVVEETGRTDGFQLTVKIPISQLAGKNEFGILYAGNNKLTSTLDAEQVQAEAPTGEGRAFGYLNVYGNIKERTGSCRCSSSWNASYATLYLYVKDGGAYRYMGATTTDANGNYDVYIDGVCGAVYVEAVAQSGKTGSNSTSVWSCGGFRTYVNVNLSLW